MSTTPTPSSPPAGWYPAPDGSADPWWWDGTRWRAYAPAPGRPPVATKGLAKLATATQALLFGCGVVSIATIGVELFGIVGVSSFFAGAQSTAGLLTTYDLLTSVVAVLGSLFIIATGVLWAIWQYRAAKLVAGRTRRAPGWHAGSWFIPVVSFWFPYQNISDLWRATGRQRPSWQIAWWLLWLASNATIWIASRIYAGAVVLDEFLVAMCVNLVGEVMLLAAVPLALLVVRGITAGVEPRAHTPAPAV